MWVRARSYINDPIGLEKWGTQPKEKRGEETQERERESEGEGERERNAVFSFSSLTLRRVGVHLASGHVGISLVVPNFISPQSSLRM